MWSLTLSNYVKIMHNVDASYYVKDMFIKQQSLFHYTTVVIFVTENVNVVMQNAQKHTLHSTNVPRMLIQMKKI